MLDAINPSGSIQGKNLALFVLKSDFFVCLLKLHFKYCLLTLVN